MHYTAIVYSKTGKIMWVDTFYNVERAAEVAGAKLRKYNDEFLFPLPGEYYVVIQPCWTKNVASTQS